MKKIKTYNDIVLTVLEECDQDIKDAMLADSNTAHFPGGPFYKIYELLPHPLDTILAWQAMRDRKHG